MTVLNCKNTENSQQIFPQKELRDHSLNFHIHVPVSDLYILMINLPILLQEIKYVDRSREYINRSQTHECGTEAAQFPDKKYINFRCSVAGKRRFAEPI